MRDCRNVRQPANLDPTNCRRESAAGRVRPKQKFQAWKFRAWKFQDQNFKDQNFEDNGALCPSHDRGSRRCRLLAGRARRPGPHPSRARGRRRAGGPRHPRPATRRALSTPRARGAPAEVAHADAVEAELAVMLTDDRGIRTLNQNWRGIDKATNVLSLPALQPTGPAGPDDAPRILGDIAIA